jgi:hypothetical protein
MSDEIKLGRVMSACTTAMIRAMGMQAENQQRIHQGNALAYDEKAFENVIIEEGVHWNAIHGILFEN